MPRGRNRCSDSQDKVCEKPRERERAEGQRRESVSVSCRFVVNYRKCRSSDNARGFSHGSGVFQPSRLLRVSRGCSPLLPQLRPRPGVSGEGTSLSSYCWQNACPCDCGTEVPVFFLAVAQGLLLAPGASCSEAPTPWQRLTHGGPASCRLGRVLGNITLRATLPLRSSNVSPSRAGLWGHIQSVSLTGKGSYRPRTPGSRTLRNCEKRA